MPDIPIQIRQKGLIDRLERHGLNALVLNAGPSLAYLTGLHFHLSERPVVAIFRPDGMPLIVLPELEEAKARALPYEVRSITYGEEPSAWPRAFDSAAAEARLDYRRIGIEPGRLRVLELRLIEEAAPRAAFLNAEDLIGELRAVKEPSEIALMRDAVQIAERALLRTLDTVRPGISEKDLANRLTLNLLDEGSAPDLPFSPIVAFGPETANPHAVPSDRTLNDGDLILIDWGANVDGYFSDITRTFSFGEPDREMNEIARVVAEANQAARRKTAPGITAHDVDAAARKVIEAAGYGEFFIHRTGHGLGLEVHEAPYIRADNVQRLQAGMTFTIEPGIYLPGRGGIRIEDDVVVTDDASESLSSVSRELRDVEQVARAERAAQT